MSGVLEVLDREVEMRAEAGPGDYLREMEETRDTVAALVKIVEAFKADPDRIAAALACCAGIETPQLVAMAEQSRGACGTLAYAYDVASDIVERFGIARLGDDLSDLSNDECWHAICEVAESAVIACRWARP